MREMVCVWRALVLFSPAGETSFPAQVVRLGWKGISVVVLAWGLLAHVAINSCQTAAEKTMIWIEQMTRNPKMHLSRFV